MKLKFSYLLCMILLISCSKYDDSAVKDDIRNLQDRVTKLETLCNVTNTNLSSLQTIVDALQQQITILQVEPLTNGYKIYFSDGNVATIQNGKNSDDVPEIGVQQDSDGIYYWTLDGVWLEDKQGNRIKAQGTDGTNGESAYELAVEKGYNGTLEEWLASLKGINGTNGKSAYELAVEKGYNGTLDEWLTSLKGTDGDDAITPQLKIENDYWYLSYDNGETWTLLGKATGEDGKDGTSCIFKSVTEDTNNVYFQLTNNTQIIIPKGENSKFAITFDNTDIAILNAGGTTTVSYTITNATDATIVKTLSQDGWKATVQPISTSAGTITITAPDPITESEILVFANDGSYRTAMASLNCTKGQILIADNSFNVDVNGGIQDVHILTNINYTIDIPSDAKSWISVIETRAMREETISFQIEPNEGTPRFATIVLRDNLQQPVQTIIFNQTSNNEIEIPDAAFKQYLLDNFDSNQDGCISYSEALEISFINVYTDNIESLSGIEYFSNLVSLVATPKHDGAHAMGMGGGQDTGYWRDSGLTLNDKRVSGKLKNLDISQNLKLEYLDCSGNIITNLDCSNNTHLAIVIASYNLDLSSIIFPHHNQIHTLQLTSTSLESINVSNLLKLEYLSIDRGLGITDLDVSNNSELRFLDVSRHKLSSIDVSHNTMLETLNCSMGNLQTLDVSNNPNLTAIYFAFNNIKKIDVSHNTKLEYLEFQNNNISNIDISMLPNLSFIHFGNYMKVSGGSITVNNITNIDLTHNTKLNDLFATMLDLETIDISQNKALTRVFVENNLLSSLDVSNSLELEELSCYNNPNLTTVFISPEQTFSYTKDDWTKFKFIGNADYYESTDYTKDGTVQVLQTASEGNGIDIVLMGDGYSDRLISDGTYDQTMHLAMEKFFSVEPYKSYRNMFNVYAVTAVSKNEVYALGTETAFSGYFGGGTYVQGNDGRVFEYAQKAITDERIDEALIIVMMNSSEYAGTSYMYFPTAGNYGNGTSIAYFPVGPDEIALEQLLHHEACGHGFTKLADEYAYEDMYEIPSSLVDQYNQQSAYGWWKNIDFTSDPSTVKWSHFLTDSRYANDGLGIYEGACTYSTGVFRPTENSIMRYNVGGFNAPSREAIYYRIHKLAYGESWVYNYEQFAEYDALNRKTSTLSYIPYRIPDNYAPLHEPVVIKKSWRDVKNNVLTKYNSSMETTNVAGSRLQKISSSRQTARSTNAAIVKDNNSSQKYMESGAKIE